MSESFMVGKATAFVKESTPDSDVYQFQYNTINIAQVSCSVSDMYSILNGMNKVFRLGYEHGTELMRKRVSSVL